VCVCVCVRVSCLICNRADDAAVPEKTQEELYRLQQTADRSSRILNSIVGQVRPSPPRPRRVWAGTHLRYVCFGCWGGGHSFRCRARLCDHRRPLPLEAGRRASDQGTRRAPRSDGWSISDFDDTQNEIHFRHQTTGRWQSRFYLLRLAAVVTVVVVVAARPLRPLAGPSPLTLTEETRALSEESLNGPLLPPAAVFASDEAAAPPAVSARTRDRSTRILLTVSLFFLILCRDEPDDNSNAR